MTREQILTDPGKVNLVLQLCVLTKQYLDSQESPEQLVEHYLTDLELDEIRYIVDEAGEVIAFADFDWIRSLEDVRKPSWERESGEILFILKCYVKQAKLMRKLLKLAPPHQWIVWERDGAIHAPKGLPTNVEQTEVLA